MEVKGCADVEVKYAGQQVTLPLYVVQGKGPSLFRRNWLEFIRPEWESINLVKSPPLEQVLEKHKAAFQDGLGICKARRVPYAMRKLVKEELE